MRKTTVVYILLGLSIYLFEVVIGISLTQQETYPDIIVPVAIQLTPQEIIQKFEPNHDLVAKKLSRSEVFVILTEQEKIYLAREYFLIGQASDGEKILQSLLLGDSPSLPAAILLADHFHSLGLFEKEFSTLTNLAEFSTDPAITNRLIPLSILFGPSILQKLDLPLMQADDPLAQIINSHNLPDERQKSRLFGAQLVRLTEWRLAERLLEEEYKSFPDNLDLYPLVALERISMGKTDESRKMLNEIEMVGLEHYQPSDQALVAMAYEFSGEPERAIEIFQGLAQSQPAESIWERNIARLIVPDKPLTALEILLDLCESTPVEENFTALLEFTIDHPAYLEPYGIDAYQKLANAENPNPAVLVSLARFDLARNEFQLALASLDKVISSGSSSGYHNKALWLRATTNLTLDNKSAAKRDLLEILHIYPPSRYSQLALQLYEANHLDSIR